MARYRVTGTVTGGKYLGEFEAGTASEAVSMALASDSASCCLCHKCADEISDPEVTDATADLIEEPHA